MWIAPTFTNRTWINNGQWLAIGSITQKRTQNCWIQPFRNKILKACCRTIKLLSTRFQEQKNLLIVSSSSNTTHKVSYAFKSFWSSYLALNIFQNSHMSLAFACNTESFVVFDIPQECRNHLLLYLKKYFKQVQ